MADASSPAKKAVKAKKPSKPKVPVAHPSYDVMIVAALTALKDRKGTSSQAIKKYIIANYKVDPLKVPVRTKVGINRGLKSGAIKQYKGTGALGSFKLPEKEGKKPAAKAKKPAAKSPKKTAKKPAAKKATKSPKKVKKAAKSPAKKPVAKKSKKPAKKPAPKK